MDVVAYERTDLSGVVALCAAEGWRSYADEPERTGRVLVAPGVTTVVARDGRTVVGFAYVQSDGEIQAHLSCIAVATTHRRRGIARAMLHEAHRQAGGTRIDLLTDTAVEFYASLSHQRHEGFRIYPPFVS